MLPMVAIQRELWPMVLGGLTVGVAMAATAVDGNGGYGGNGLGRLDCGCGYGGYGGCPLRMARADYRLKS